MLALDLPDSGAPAICRESTSNQKSREETEENEQQPQLSPSCARLSNLNLNFLFKVH
jgi:hypothetical protein